MTTAYHYTKGYRLFQILSDQRLKSFEMMYGEKLNSGDRWVWLTREERYPKTALPAIKELPQTMLTNQLHAPCEVDLLEVARYVSGIWRFKFELKKHPEIKPWLGSYQRSRLLKKDIGKYLERTARSVGDRVALWSIATNELSIGDSVLQQFTPQGWADRLIFAGHAEDMTVENIEGFDAGKIMRNSFYAMKRAIDEMDQVA